jgi:hypothetical protein
VRILDDPTVAVRGWEFPMALDVDGQWRFAIGEVVRLLVGD